MGLISHLARAKQSSIARMTGYYDIDAKASDIDAKAGTSLKNQPTQC